EDPQSSAELRSSSEARLAQLTTGGGRVAFETDAEAVLVDGFALGPEELARGVLVRAGPHVVEAYREGRVVARRTIHVHQERELRVTFAEKTVASTVEPSALATTEEEARPPRERPAWLRNKWVWIGVSAAAV